MQLLSFASYKSYTMAQYSTVRRRGIGPFFSETEIVNISNWMKDKGLPCKNIICHGARCGSEVDAFSKQFPEATAIGTDLFPKHGKSTVWNTKATIIKHDFMQQKREWVGLYDIVYSNSLDHACDPFKCVSVWMDQLSATGRLCVQWSRAHRDVNGGDCFGASLDEYVDLFMGIGHVDDVIPTLYAPARRVNHCFTIVTRKRTRRERRRGIL